MQNQHLDSERAGRGGRVPITVQVGGGRSAVVEKYELLCQQNRVSGLGARTGSCQTTQVGKFFQDEGTRFTHRTLHLVTGARIRAGPYEGAAAVVRLSRQLAEQIENGEDLINGILELRKT